MPWTALLVLIVASVLPGACSKGDHPPPGVDQLIGTWEAILPEHPELGLVPAPQMTFVPDGTYFMDLRSGEKSLHEQFAWKVESEDGTEIVVTVTHPSDGRHETLKIRFLDPDKIRVEGAAPLLFRRVR